MKIVAIASLLVLSACTTMPAVNCANAGKVRAAATLALQAVDRVCPFQSEAF